MNIGNKIRELRIRKGFSQENMAELLKMTTTGYAKIEQNKTPNVSLKKLEMIAEKLDTNIFELLSIGEKNISYVHQIEGSNNSGMIVYQNNYDDKLIIQENGFLKEKISLLESKIKDLEAIVTLLKNSFK